MINSYRKIIRQIVKFRQDIAETSAMDGIPESISKISNRLAGTLGELYVIEALHKHGFKDLEYKSGQSSYDIFINGIGTRVEVKTSLLKNEGIYPKGINFYGWRVKDRTQKRDQKFDILVCVALPDDFQKPVFYVFTYKEAFSVDDVKIGRYPNIQKKICVYETSDSFKEAIRTRPHLVTRYEALINKNLKKFQDRWGIIKAK